LVGKYKAILAFAKQNPKNFIACFSFKQ